MIKELTKRIEADYKKETNYFGYGAWTHHILLVVKYSKLMAKQHGADEEIVEIAALLHDYAGVLDYKLYQDHHIHSAQVAEQILREHQYPLNKIEKVKDCIMNHRGSTDSQRTTNEALSLADADSMAHFDSIPSLLYLAYFSHKMSIDEANIWLQEKLERSWNKLSPKAKEIMKEKYEASKVLFC